MPIEEIILKLRYFRYWLLFLFLASFISTYYYMYEYRTFYTAEAVIMLNDIDLTDVGLTEKDVASMARYNSFNVEKFYRVLYSDQLLLNIDAKLKLGEHYGIPKTAPNYFYRLTNKFSGRLIVHKDGLDIINLMIEDKTIEYAPVLMEAILTELKAINRKNSEEMINERFRVVSIVQKQLQENYSSFVDSITKALTLLRSSSAHQISAIDYLDLKYGVLRTADKLDAMSQSFDDYTKMSAFSNEAFKSDGLEKLHVLNKKYYNPKAKKIIINTSVSLMVSVLTLTIFILAGYFYFINRKLFSLFLKGKAEE